MDSIGDARGFSGKTPIIPSGDFSVETLTGVTPSWKTELNKSISAVKDGIPRWLQHHHKTCYEKGGHCGRQACMFWMSRSLMVDFILFSLFIFILLFISFSFFFFYF